MFRSRGHPWRVEDDLLDWFYVRYKSVYAVLGLAVVLLAGWGSYRLAVQARRAAPDLAALGDTRFARVDGIVSVRKAGLGEWLPADRRTSLGRYDLVRTGPQAVAEIVFPDHSVVHVRPDSLISLQGHDRDAASGRQVAWHVSAGEVFMRTGERTADADGPAPTFSSPGARGTLSERAEAALRVDPVGTSVLRQFAGQSRLETKDGPVEVAAAQAVRVDARGQPGPAVTLPPPPDLLEPPHQAKVAAPGAQPARVLLAWRPVPGARTYRLVMDRSAQFGGPFVDRRGLTDTKVEVRGLERGRYYWRVAGEGAGELEGRFSEYARLTVATREDLDAVTAPPLQLDQLDLGADFLHVKGSTAPGASVSVNGRRLAVREDGSFSDFVQLDQAGSQTVAVRATGPDGGTVVRQIPVVGH